MYTYMSICIPYPCTKHTTPTYIQSMHTCPSMGIPLTHTLTMLYQTTMPLHTMCSHIIPCHAIKSCHVLHQIMPCHILPCSATQYHYILCVRRAQAAKKTLADAGPYRRQGDTETDKERTLETRNNMYQSDRHRCRSVGDVSGHVLMYPDRHRYNMYY